MGLTICYNTLAYQFRLLIEQIEFTEKQIEKIDKLLARLLKKLNSVIMTIPGVGPVTGAIILGEIRDINRFDNP